MQLISPLWATHIGYGAESGASHVYMRHRTVQAAQHTYETRLGLHRLLGCIVAAYVGECLLYQPNLTSGWLHGSSPKCYGETRELSSSRAAIYRLSSKDYMPRSRALRYCYCCCFAALWGHALLRILARDANRVSNIPGSRLKRLVTRDWPFAKFLLSLHVPTEVLHLPPAG